MLVHNLVVTGSLTFPTALPISGSLLVSGSMGIGTASPTSKLVVVGDAIRYMPVSDANGNSVLVIKDDSSDGTLDIASEIIGNANGSSSPITFRVSSIAGGRFEAMRITNSGSVMIGTSSFDNGNFTSTATGLNVCAAAPISLLKESSTSRTFYMALSGNAFLATKDAISIIFSTTDVERMRITAAGNVGIGTTNPAVALHILSGTAGSSGRSRLIHATSGAQIDTYVGASDGCGIIVNNNPLFFEVNSAERMRITSDGNLEVKTSGAYISFFGTTQNVALQSFDNNTLRIRTLLAGNGALNVENLGTGIVYSNGATLTSTNPSDSRLKENIKDISWGLIDILKIRPVSYHWKDDKINQGVQFGFIAQEVQDIMPEAIKEFGEDIIYLGLEKDAIYATLVKAIQEQQATIEALTTRITALEN